ncbi:hypothetical protein AB0H77_27435 [Streptomyces sp. NPDC050844]|uniref:hypothetical protein n=1 Tax=Streptomyces sp. NPDC050844 TaxID=3155790 RepID=UPI003409ECCF
MSFPYRPTPEVRHAFGPAVYAVVHVTPSVGSGLADAAQREATDDNGAVARLLDAAFDE